MVSCVWNSAFTSLCPHAVVGKLVERGQSPSGMPLQVLVLYDKLTVPNMHRLLSLYHMACHQMSRLSSLHIIGIEISTVMMVSCAVFSLQRSCSHHFYNIVTHSCICLQFGGNLYAVTWLSQFAQHAPSMILPLKRLRNVGCSMLLPDVSCCVMHYCLTSIPILEHGCRSKEWHASCGALCSRAQSTGP